MPHIELNTVPGLLAHIPDPPKKLYAEGDISLLMRDDVILVCIVGPRKASPYGRDVVDLVLRHLQRFNAVTVSGIAYGIDAIVHDTSIRLGIPTIAIPGSGIDDDVFYPRAHLDLKHEILDHGGLIVNEFDPLVRAAPFTFPVRNRLMAGMSHLTIVIEAERKSGTLITAHLAADYGREVLVVPGSIFSLTSAGTHELAGKGATLLASLDVLTETLKLIAERDGIELYKKEFEETESTETSDKVENITAILETLSKDERRIYDCVLSHANGMAKSDICRLLDMSTSEVSIYVTLLELHGVVRMRLGKVWAVV